MSENRERTPNEIRLANLMPPWKPGQSGNELGRPIGTKDGLVAIVRRLGEKKTYPEFLNAMHKRGIDLESGSHFEAVAHALFLQAEQGDVQAIKLLKEMDEERTGSFSGPNMNFPIQVNFIGSNGSSDNSTT